MKAENTTSQNYMECKIIHFIKQMCKYKIIVLPAKMFNMLDVHSVCTVLVRLLSHDVLCENE